MRTLNKLLYKWLRLVSFVVLFLSGCSKNAVYFQVEPTTIIFEDAEVGTTVKQTVTIKNLTKEPLKNLLFSSSCGCTLVNEPPSSISPGGSGSFEVVYQVPSKSGPIKERVVIETTAEKYTLPIIGNATKSVHFDPTIIAIETEPEISRYYRTFSIECLRSQKIEKVIGNIQPSTSQLEEHTDELLSRVNISINEYKPGKLLGVLEYIRKDKDSSFYGDVSISIKIQGKEQKLNLPIKFVSKNVEYSPEYISIEKEKIKTYNNTNPLSVLIQAKSFFPLEINKVNIAISKKNVKYEVRHVNLNNVGVWESWISVFLDSEIIDSSTRYMLLEIYYDENKPIKIPIIIS